MTAAALALAGGNCRHHRRHGERRQRLPGPLHHLPRRLCRLQRQPGLGVRLLAVRGLCEVSIRRALGAPKINFYGGSWGTSLGSGGAQLYPAHVRRMVLDRIVGPTISWYDHNSAQDKEHQRRFEGAIHPLRAAPGCHHPRHSLRPAWVLR
ncbi:alpha/beta fold hydrolase [Streptomyces sp. NPDC059533]|uniref:alpha/beta fold hydrolase n=1 Tax=Streptomyces sp. NPDC059533 TaxID=3346858 RepID=UPI00367F2E37